MQTFPVRDLAEPYMDSRPLSHYWVPGGLPEFVAQGIQAERHLFLVRGVPIIPGPACASASCIGGTHMITFTTDSTLTTC